MAKFRVADLAEREFAAELDPANRHSITIPEWNGVTIYWGPWTIEDLERTVFARDWDSMGGPGRIVRALVTKGQFEDGKSMFVPPEEDQLRLKARPAIIDRIGAELFKSLKIADDPATAEKK